MSGFGVHMVFYIPAMGSRKFPCLVHLVTMKARPLVGQMVISCHLICSSLSTAKRITILWLEHQRKMFIYMSHEKARPYFLLIVYHNPFFRVKFPCKGVPWKLASKVSKLAYFTYLGDEINLLMQGLYSTSKLLYTMDISVRIFSPYLEPLRIRLYVLRKGWDPYIPILFGWDCNSQSYSIREGSRFLGNDLIGLHSAPPKARHGPWHLYLQKWGPWQTCSRLNRPQSKKPKRAFFCHSSFATGDCNWAKIVGNYYRFCLECTSQQTTLQRTTISHLGKGKSSSKGGKKTHLIKPLVHLLDANPFEKRKVYKVGPYQL